MGGTDIYNEGHWVWHSDHVTIDSNDQSWETGQLMHSPEHQDCMKILHLSPSGKWHDGDCTEGSNGFMCQKPFM